MVNKAVRKKHEPTQGHPFQTFHGKSSETRADRLEIYSIPAFTVMNLWRISRMSRQTFRNNAEQQSNQEPK
jgi:hypothetical protein